MTAWSEEWYQQHLGKQREKETHGLVTGNPQLSYLNSQKGMGLEDTINLANETYYNKRIATITKIPTPVTVVKVDKNGRITEGYYGESTIDYIGIKGLNTPVAFEAKECREKTRFPLKNIKAHQLDFLKSYASRHEAEVFFLIEMIALGKVFKVPVEVIEKFWVVAQKGGSKSIPVADMDNWEVINSGGGIALDYLQIYSK